MLDCVGEKACQALQHARGDLTNEPTYYRLGLTGNNKANCARCANTSHSSDPTLSHPVSGLQSIIANRGALVLRGFGGPTDRCVGEGRFAVLGMGEA